MKKLGMTLLAGALSLPLTFAATQATATPSNGQAQTQPAKPAKKKPTHVKKHVKKTAKTPTSNSAAPATK
jgi:hypothetical protein